jgi:hypothetical protein
MIYSVQFKFYNLSYENIMKKTVLITSILLGTLTSTAWAVESTKQNHKINHGDMHKADVFAESKPDVFASPKADVFAESKADVFASPKADVFAESKPDVFASPKADVFAESKPDVFASPKADVFAESKADTLNK